MEALTGEMVCLRRTVDLDALRKDLQVLPVTLLRCSTATSSRPQSQKHAAGCILHAAKSCVPPAVACSGTRWRSHSEHCA